MKKKRFLDLLLRYPLRLSSKTLFGPLATCVALSIIHSFMQSVLINVVSVQSTGNEKYQ
jgi:hypothetical protein